jgi:hypothetical protein
MCRDWDIGSISDIGDVGQRTIEFKDFRGFPLTDTGSDAFTAAASAH